MRTANPGDLDDLAKLLDGRGGVQDKVDEAFTRAAQLGMAGKLASLKPLRSWATDTAPDLRRRATLVRLEDGDPEAGLRWAGLSPEELKSYQGDGLTPDFLLLANSLAASEDPKALVYRRLPGESTQDWIERVAGNALLEIPGLPFHEESVRKFVEVLGDWHSAAMAASVVTLTGTSLTRVMVGNTVSQGPGAAWKLRVGTRLASSRVPLAPWTGNRLLGWTPPIRSLGAPGAWLPGQLGGMFANSPTYQNVTRIPFTTNLRGDFFSNVWDRFRALPVIRSAAGQKTINFIVGSDEAAIAFGGTTHSGLPVLRAGQASLVNVFRNAAANAPEGTSAFRSGAGATVRTAGAMRGLGVVGGVASTALSAENVVRQGWPWDAFQKKGAGYVADVSETLFNASLTAAMVAPTPFTIGAAVVTGAIYGGLKIYEHRKDIAEGMGKARDWAKEKAKAAAKKLNPFKW